MCEKTHAKHLVKKVTILGAQEMLIIITTLLLQLMLSNLLDCESFKRRNFVLFIFASPANKQTNK